MAGNIDYLHFHNYMEIGYCYEGSGVLTMGNRDVRFSGKEFFVLQKQFAEGITGAVK